jgi:preprotein translocase subunit SecF
MEIIIALVAVVVVGALIYFNRSAKSLDINNDGKVDLTDAKAAVDNAVAGVASAADVNKDGKVDADDAKAVVEKAKTEVKKATTKAKSAAKKATTRGRKPKAQ